MHRNRMPVALLAAILILLPLATLAPPVAAGGPQAGTIADGLLPGTGGPVDANPNQTIGVMVRFAGPSLLEIRKAAMADLAATGAEPLNKATLETLRQTMARRQAPAIQAVESTGATVIDSYQVIANGLLVNATPDQIRAIAELPGVVSVARAPVHVPLLGKSVPHLGASMVWEELGFDGSGVNVAVIDTGIDYTHAAYGGPGRPQDFTMNDPTIVEPDTFPTAKVVGGYDLVGEIYSAACPDDPQPPMVCTNVPEPDDDPLDYSGGHGTHVSGIVASLGTDDGGVDKGMAPGAGIVLLKVFGDPTGVNRSTTMSSAAVEWATRHNLDMDVPGTPPEGPIHVINMSLGSDWGGSMQETNRVVDAALEAGITVISSAGNDGNRPYIAGSPAAADNAVSVAGTHPPGDLQDVVQNRWEEGGQTQTLNPLALQGADDWLPQIEETGVISGTLAWYGLACNDDQGNPTPPAQDLTEKIALIERGTCPFYDKIWNAEKMGAIAAVLFTDNRDKTIMACAAPSDCGNSPSIPGLMMDREPGLTLKSLVYEEQVEVTTILDPGAKADLVDSIMQMSSRGPSRYNSTIKPQVAAPGNSIVSANAGTGSEGVAFSGTSMAGPFAVGAAALLWERNIVEDLGLTAADIGAMVISYADPIVKQGNPATGPLVPVPRQGAGRVDAYASATGETLVRTASGLAALSYGNPRVLDEMHPISKSIEISNLGETDRHYAPQAQFMYPDEDADQGASFSFDTERLSVAAGTTATLEVSMVIDPETLRPWQLGDETTISDEARFSHQEFDGHIKLVEVDDEGNPVEDGDAPHVPFLALPRRSSCVELTTPGGFSLSQAGDSVEHSWDNQCGEDGAVEVYHLVAEDPAESAMDETWAPYVDVENVGVRWGKPGEDEPMMLEWAIQTAGARRIPYDVEFHVYVDSDLNGDFDYAVFNIPEQTASGYSGRWLVGYAPVIPGSLGIDGGRAVLERLMRFDIDEATSILQVEAEPIGVDLSNGDAKFDFIVVAIDLPGDYPETDTYLGYDEVPEDLSEGGRFSFDQAVLECFQLVAADDSELGGYRDVIDVPAGESQSIRIALAQGCEASGDPIETAFFMKNTTNLLGEAGYDVRRGLLGQHSIYLPYSAKGHELWKPPVEVTIDQKRDSGVHGTAVLVETESGVVVTVNLEGTEPDSAHPVKIMTGTCDEPGELVADIGVTMEGMAGTLLEAATIDEFLDGNHVIVVELGIDDETVVACGPIETPAEPTQEPVPTQEPEPTGEPGPTDEPEPTAEPTGTTEP